MLRITLDAAPAGRLPTAAAEYLSRVALALARRGLDVTMLIGHEAYETDDFVTYFEKKNFASIRFIDMNVLSHPIERYGALRHVTRVERARDLERVIEPGSIYHTVGSCNYSGSVTRANIVTCLEADEDLQVDLPPVDLVVATSRPLARMLAERFGVPEDRIVMSHTGVRTIFDTRAYWSRTALLKWLGLDTTRRFVLVDDRVHAPTQLGVVLDAYAKLRNCCSEADKVSLVILGSRETLLDVERFPTLQTVRSDIVVLDKADLDIQPSLYHYAEMLLKYNINVPISFVVEAMKAGCPIICVNACVVSETLCECAELVHTVGPDHLLEAMLRLIEDRSYADALRFAALVHSDRFTWERHVDDLIRIYEAF